MSAGLQPYNDVPYVLYISKIIIRSFRRKQILKLLELQRTASFTRVAVVIMMLVRGG